MVTVIILTMPAVDKWEKIVILSELPGGDKRKCVL